MAGTGKNIISLRRKSGITVRELQDILVFRTPQAIYKWQSGRGAAYADNLVILAAALNVTTDQILVTDLGKEEPL
jgi:transcriptional regulator with XRE-family HTH domain